MFFLEVTNNNLELLLTNKIQQRIRNSILRRQAIRKSKSTQMPVKKFNSYPLVSKCRIMLLWL